MATSDKSSFFRSRIPKASLIPRARSKSGDRFSSRSQTTSLEFSRSKSAPKTVSMNNERDSPEEMYNDDSSYHNDSGQNSPNKFPQYQGISPSNNRQRQGILVNHQNQPDSSNNSIKSEFSSAFRNKQTNNDYLEREHALTHDISSMFQRPANTIPSLQRPAASLPMTPNSWGRQEQLSKGYENNKGWSNAQAIKEYPAIMSPNNNSTIGFKSSYSTAEELDNILAKYKSMTPPPREQEYHIYPSTVQTNYNPQMDSSNSYQNNYHNNCHIPKPPNKAVVDHNNRRSEPQPPSSKPKDNLGVFGLPLENNFKNRQNDNSKERDKKLDDNRDTKQRSSNSKNRTNANVATHKFPFKETPEGEFIVQPDQIAFESKTVSVVVADPTQIWSVKAEKYRDVRDQESLLKEVEDTINRGINKFYDRNNLEALDRDGQQAYRKSIENEYLNKEILAVKYSDSKMGTDKLMMDVHHRLRSGRHADTHVMIGNTIYPCHSIALEVVSKFFDNLNRPKETLRRIELPESEVPATVFPTLMDWILQNDHGRSACMNKSNVVPLFSAGKYLDISELKSQCVNYLQEKVETNDRHLMTLWEEVKKRPNCHELMVVISAKAALSFQHIFRERKFLNLDVDELVMLLSSDEIVIQSELDVFDTCVQWLLHNWDERKLFTNEVVNTVRFGLLTPLQLTQISHYPELAKGTTYPHEYPELLSYGSVKSMIDDGLAFSIVNESYKNQPEEIRKWVESTGIKAPRPRNRTQSNSSSKIFLVPTDSSVVSGNRPNSGVSAERRPSYTIFQRKNSTDSLDSHPEHSDYIGENGREKSKRSRSASRGYDYTNNSGSRRLEDLADTLGSPIKQEDIQNLGPSQIPPPLIMNNANSSNRSRSNSRENKNKSYK